MKQRHVSLVLATLTLVAVGVVGCVREPLATSTDGLDKKLTLTSYKQEGELLALVVGVKLAHQRAERGYVPIEVGIVNKNVPALNLTAESFTLIDDGGTRLPAIGRAEALKDYGDVDLDLRLAELPELVGSRWGSYERVDGVLTPSFARPIPRTLNLPRHSYSVDILYFPATGDGPRGREYELLLDSPELDDPVVISFAVP